MQGNLEITGVINPDGANVGYVNIDVVIPVGAHIRISSFQLVNVNVAEDVDFDEVSTQKQKNGLFQYYENSLVYMPRTNILTNWGNIKITQFSNKAVTSISAQCSYVADQTILYQTGANKLRFGIDEQSNFIISPQASATDCRFALIQYVDPENAANYWDYWVSCLTRAILSTDHGSSIRLKTRVIWRDTLPSSISAVEPIASWANGSDPVFSAGWTEIAPLNDPAYVISTLGSNDAGASVYPPYAFDQFQLPAPTNSGAQTLGFVIYIMDGLDSTSGTEDAMFLNRISLTPNQFAIDASHVTSAQNLVDCEFYYEKSYSYDTLPAAATDINIMTSYQYSYKANLDTAVFVRPTTFFINYRTPKRTVPTLTIYANNGTAASVTVVAQSEVGGPTFEQVEAVTALFGIWGAAAAGVKRSEQVPSTLTAIQVNGFTTGADVTSAYLIYHYVADSRIGI